MKHYGLHRHFTGGTSVVMFGGGMKRGFLYGKTAEERPLVAVENPGHGHRSARHDHDRDGDQPQDRIRHRRPPVLRDPGRQGPAGDGHLCVSIGLEITVALSPLPCREAISGGGDQGGGVKRNLTAISWLMLNRPAGGESR